MSLMMEKGLSLEFLTADAVFMGMTRKLVVEERGGCHRSLQIILSVKISYVSTKR